MQESREEKRKKNQKLIKLHENWIKMLKVMSTVIMKRANPRRETDQKNTQLKQLNQFYLKNSMTKYEVMKIMKWKKRGFELENLNQPQHVMLQLIKLDVSWHADSGASKSAKSSV